MLLRRLTTPVLEEHCYVLASGHGSPALVIDPGAATAPAVRDALAEQDLSLGAVALTHGHADHVWDAAGLAGSSPVYIGGPDAHRLDDPASALGVPLGEMFAAAAGTAWVRPARVEHWPGEVLAGEGAELVPGVVVRAVPAPGHTEGSTLLLVRGAIEDPDGALPASVAGEEDLLLALCGDVIFAGSIGRTDLPGGDEREMIATLRTLATSLPPSTVLLPGHGPATVLAHEITGNAHVRAAMGRSGR